MDVYSYNNTYLYLVSTTALNTSSISPRYPLSPFYYYRVTYHLPASLCFCVQQLAPASLHRGLTLASRSCHALPHRKLRGPGSFCCSPNQMQGRPHSFPSNTWSSSPASCLSRENPSSSSLPNAIIPTCSP